MIFKDETSLGIVTVKEEGIKKVVSFIALETLNIIGLTSANKLKNGVWEALRKDHFAKGIEIKTEEDIVSISLCVIVKRGAKIADTCQTLQTKVAAEIKRIFNLQVKFVHITVLGISD